MNVRSVLLMLMAMLLGACVRTGHIQQTLPVKDQTFVGDHKAVAQCVQRRLGGRVQDESFGEKYIVYDSAKGRGDFTHWSVTVARTGNGAGLAEWRVIRPAQQGGFSTGSPGGTRPASSAFWYPSDDIVREFWQPVLDCIAQAKGS